ncbi:hypothetical protein ACN4EG_20080 [Alkalinema pantanalense CENA528]|uniref:hypothetical protein n=1 Tax=Alkalinema pantanalense TaxID=1620705 RepID=UPI003D6DF19B
MSENNQLSESLTTLKQSLIRWGTQIKVKWLSFSRNPEAEAKQSYQELKQGLESLDQQMIQRYGDRYLTVRGKATDAKDWYNQQLDAQRANPDQPVLAERKQTQVERKVNELGQTVSRMEKELLAQVKNRLRSDSPKP